jgi:hypothetical protein
MDSELEVWMYGLGWGGCFLLGMLCMWIYQRWQARRKPKPVGKRALVEEDRRPDLKDMLFTDAAQEKAEWVPLGAASTTVVSQSVEEDEEMTLVTTHYDDGGVSQSLEVPENFIETLYRPR